MSPLPTGTVSFVFTDVEGSTRLLEREPEAYGEALKRHDAILRGAVAAHEGVVFETIGDAVYAAFAQPSSAVAAALDAQIQLQSEPWPKGSEIRVRAAIHTGEVELRGDHYFGRALYRCARLMAIASGGQVLVSSATASLVGRDLPSGASLRSLGMHRLKDLGEAEEPYQLEHPRLEREFPPLRSLDARPHNLPVEISSFVGRDRELSEVRALLESKRLVTITGPGGTGKTRLALQVAADATDAFTAGVFFVPLESITDPRRVATEIAHALGVRELGGEPIVDRLKTHLAATELLLVLDNFEQVIDAADVVSDVMRAAKKLKVIVTSRAVLRIAGEQEYPLPPLAVPEADAGVESLGQSGAIRLFIERAAESAPGFALTADNAHQIAVLCRRLDGLPLAIELAAARVRLMSLDSLLARLDDSLGLLVAGRRDAPARQRTLRGAIAWSYDLLPDGERELFRRLSVFSGGFTLEAAEAVCDGSSALDAISTLVENSLVRRDDVSGDRFAMLGTIREFGLEHLSSDPGEHEVRRRHAGYFLALAERSQEIGPDGADALAHEHDNVRSAIEWAITGDEGQLALRLAAAAMTPVWWRHSRWEEGTTLLRGALALPSVQAPTSERAAALLALGELAITFDMHEARAALEESVRLLRSFGEGPELVIALTQLGNAHLYRGDIAAFEATTKEALGLAQRANPEMQWVLKHNLAMASAFAGDLDSGRAMLQDALREGGSSVTLLLLSEIERMTGNYQDAAKLGERALTQLRSKRADFYTAMAIPSLALTVARAGDLPRARTLSSEGVQLCSRLGHRLGLPDALAISGILNVDSGLAASAARLFGAADALRARAGVTIWYAVRADLETATKRARAELGDAVYARAVEAGKAMSLEAAVAAAQE